MGRTMKSNTAEAAQARRGKNDLRVAATRVAMRPKIHVAADHVLLVYSGKIMEVPASSAKRWQDSRGAVDRLEQLTNEEASILARKGVDFIACSAKECCRGK